jgi:hypothetical protein
MVIYLNLWFLILLKNSYLTQPHKMNRYCSCELLCGTWYQYKLYGYRVWATVSK